MLMKTVQKMMATLVIVTTTNFMHAAATDQSQIDLDNQLLEAVKVPDDLQLQAVKDLLDQGANPNALGFLDDTPLHLAALHNNIEIAKLLLDRGVDVNAANLFGGTPLFYAAGHNHLAMTQLLLDRGADANLTDNGGKTAKAIAAKYKDIVKSLQDWEDMPLTKGAYEKCSE